MPIWTEFGLRQIKLRVESLQAAYSTYWEPNSFFELHQIGVRRLWHRLRLRTPFSASDPALANFSRERLR
jgi:hypothetical protein